MMDRRHLWTILVLAMWVSPARAYELDYGRRGLQVDFESIPLELRAGGRLHLDFGGIDEDLTPQNDQFKVRRGRIYLSGKAFEDWSFKVEHDFAPKKNGWRNIWLGYAFDKKTSVRLGNFVAPFGLEDVAASNYSTFLERAVSSAIAPSYQTGLGVRTRGRVKHEYGSARWTAAAMGYVEPLLDADAARHRSKHYGFATRLTVAPFSAPRRLLHLGASFEYRDIRRGRRYKISSRPESSLAQTLFSTGRLRNVDEVVSFGAEAATVLGPFSAQAEYMRAMLDRKNRKDPDFDGWYVQASWVVTGETRRYGRGSGAFRGVNPKRSFGALELALRYSSLDLVDGGVIGGKTNDFTAGVNWYLLRNVRLMFNYVHVDSKQRRTQLNDDPDVFQGRFLVFF